MKGTYQKLAYALQNSGVHGAIDPILEQTLNSLGNSAQNLEGELRRKDNPPWDANLGAGVEGVLYANEDVTITVPDRRTGKWALALDPQRTETPVELAYERGHLQTHPSLITRVKGHVGDDEVNLQYERFGLGAGHAKVTKVAGTVGENHIEVRYNHPFKTADVYVNGRKVPVQFDERREVA